MYIHMYTGYTSGYILSGLRSRSQNWRKVGAGARIGVGSERKTDLAKRSERKGYRQQKISITKGISNMLPSLPSHIPFVINTYPKLKFDLFIPLAADLLLGKSSIRDIIALESFIVIINKLPN